MDILIWLIIALVCGFVIVFAFLFIQIIKPTLNSPARFFMEAKRKNKPVCILDNGSHWTVVVGEKQESDGIIKDKFDNTIIVTPNSMKYCMGVLVGVGENYRSIVVNPGIIEIISKLKEKGIYSDDVRNALEELENANKNSFIKEGQDEDTGTKEKTGESEQKTTEV